MFNFNLSWTLQKLLSFYGTQNLQIYKGATFMPNVLKDVLEENCTFHLTSNTWSSLESTEREGSETTQPPLWSMGVLCDTMRLFTFQRHLGT